MATRAVNKTAKEGEQNARLLLSRGALSAMAIFRRAAFPSVRRWRDAPRRTRCSLQPRQHSVFRASGGGVLQVLPSAPFLCGEGGGYLVRGESKRSSMARSSRMRSRTTGSGNILARCVPKCLAVARSHHGAFPGVNPWQFFRLMYPKSGLGRENRQFVTRFARHASEMSWLWQDMRAMHPKSPANSRLGIHRAKILP